MPLFLENKTCEACPAEQPNYNPVDNTCNEACEDKKVWTGSECLTCYEIDETLPVFNNGACEACGTVKSEFDLKTSTCVCPNEGNYYEKLNKCVVCDEVQSEYN